MKNKPIRVKDLKDQIGTPTPRPILKCFECGNEFSAYKGDYWSVEPEHVFKCCDENMALVTKHVTFKPVN